MHYYSGMLDSDLKRIEGQKESRMRTKIASMTCKSIATWRTYEFLKVQQIKNSEELLKRNEEMILSLFCISSSNERILVHKCKDSFEIMATKFVPYFEGEKD